MSGEKYIGMDVHQATISMAVMDSQGKVIMESSLGTKASIILDFFSSDPVFCSPELTLVESAARLFSLFVYLLRFRMLFACLSYF